ncbi:MAG: hypothetical protein V1494_06890 [Candidatus Diapherotrites archaeon]
MKKLLILLIFILIFNFLVLAENEHCSIAAPVFGVVLCDSANTEQYDYPEYEIQTGATSSVVDLPCVSQCNISDRSSITDPEGRSLNDPNNKFCEDFLWRLDLRILDGDNIVWRRYYKDLKEKQIGGFPITFGYPKTLKIVGTCIGVLGDEHPLRSGSKIKVDTRKIYLYENPDNTTNFVMMPGTVGCVPTDFVSKYYPQKAVSENLPTTYFETSTTTKSLSGQYKSINQISYSFANNPTNLHAGETYTFLSGWKIIPDIGIIYDKDNMPNGYCMGGSPGNRNLMSFSKIDTVSGACYLIPTSVKSVVECCYNEDCKWKDPTGALLCDPNTFSCTDSKPCDTDIDCQVPGQVTCLNNTETIWSCDLTHKIWPSKNGSCTKSTNKVLCCSDSECGPNEVCNRTEGCKARYTLQDCPYSSCCSEGRNYKAQDCASGQECCKAEGSYVGQCKDSCEPVKVIAEGSEASALPNTGSAVLSSENSLSSALPIIIVLIIVGLVGVAAYFFYLKPQQAPTNVNAIICPKCNSQQKATVNFCTSCGERLKG